MANHLVHNTISGLTFLRFSRSQRISLVLLIVICLLFSYFIRHQLTGPISSPYQADLLVVEELEAFVAAQDAKVSFSSPQRNANYAASPYGNYHKTTPNAKPARLFAFDPNTVSLEELHALGLNPRAAQNLVNYREKGGLFRKPEDLKKLYSLKPEDAQRLIPFVRIEALEAKNAIEVATINNAPSELPASVNENVSVSGSSTKTITKLSAPIDINLADSFSLTLLPGIGAKRAGAICRYREKLGGFATLEQVSETYGLPDSVFRQMLPYITLGNGPVNKICLNTSTESQLKNHPYVGWQMAKIIIAYRNQHGPFQSVDDLGKIYAIKKDWLEKVKPHLQIESKS